MPRLSMPDHSLLATLRRGDWFATLPAPLQQRILDAGEQIGLAEGERLFARGDAPDGLYCVLQGTVRISTVNQAGREMIVALLEPPHWFGEIALFDNEPRTHDAWATADTCLLRLAQRKLENMLELHPQDWLYFGRLLTRKLRAVFSAMEDMALTPPTARLARRLVNMADGFGTLTEGSQRTITVSQEALGAMLSLSRQTINQSLKELEVAGAIRRMRGAIVIVEIDRLIGRGSE